VVRRLEVLEPVRVTADPWMEVVSST
jgi:hypothetical protein